MSMFIRKLPPQFGGGINWGLSQKKKRKENKPWENKNNLLNSIVQQINSTTEYRQIQRGGWGG